MNNSAFDQAVDLVYSYIKRKNTLDTERPARVRQVLDATGNPQVHFKAVHVTGTKGKGSTCAMIAAALQANGYRVGLYTSPHLHNIRERIQVNSIPIPEHDLTHWATHLRRYFDAVEGIGFPEVMTCLAYHYFAASDVDFAVIEVHLGGRYDATNVITPVCAAITTIDYDHMDILGDTLEKIAYQKAGIIKQGVPVISAPQPEAVMTVLREEASQQRAALTVTQHTAHPPTVIGQRVDIQGAVYHTNLIGAHQALNLAVAIYVLKQIQQPLDDTRTQQGLNQVRWGGRLEIVQYEPIVVLDIAHNHAAAITLRKTLDALFASQKRVFVYASKENKDVKAILAALVRPQDTLILTMSSDPPTATPEQLKPLTPSVDHIERLPESKRAYQRALELAQSDGLVCVTGSIFLVSEVR